MALSPRNHGEVRSPEIRDALQPSSNDSTLVSMEHVYPSGPNASTSMSTQQSANYVLANTRACRFEETYAATPRSCDPMLSPYELQLLMQSPPLSENHRTSPSNYTINAEHHGNVQIDDVADCLKGMKLEPDDIKNMTEGVIPVPSKSGYGTIVADKSSVDETLLPDTVEKIEEAKDGDLSQSSCGGNDSCLETATMKQLITPALANMKQHLIGSTMEFCHSVGLIKTEFQQCHNGQDGGSSHSNGGTNLGGSSLGQEASPSGHSRGWSLGGSQQEEKSQEDDDEGKKRPNKKRKLGSDPAADEGQKFACPYFKRRPYDYRNERACTGPGFCSVHRLKEHLYRGHRQAIQCPRCAMVFTIDQDLIDHLADSERCTLTGTRVLPHDQGFSKEQEKQLRRRTIPTKTEPEKWSEVYMILFPDDDPEKMPSPYYEHEHLTSAEEFEARDADTMTRYQERCRVELPLIVQNKLEEMIDEELIPILEKLKTLVLEVVRTAQEELFEGTKDTIPSATPYHPSHFITGRAVCLESRPCHQGARLTEQGPSSSHSHNRLSSDSGYASNHVFKDSPQPNQSMASNSDTNLHFGETDSRWLIPFEDTTEVPYTQGPAATPQCFLSNAHSAVISTDTDIIALPAYDIADPGQVFAPTPLTCNPNDDGFLADLPTFFDMITSGVALDPFTACQPR